jgi:hypothetical protein
MERRGVHMNAAEEAVLRTIANAERQRLGSGD